MSQDRASWSVKNTDVLNELKTMLDVTSAEQEALKSVQSQAQTLAPQFTEAFYARLFAQSNTKEYLEGASMDRLHSMVQDWFIRLFSGQYDEEYFKHRSLIGQIHVRVGLPVRYPLAMLDVVSEFGEKIAASSANPELTLKAFRKVLSLDIAIFNQSYENNQLEHLAELVGGERLARRLLQDS